MRHFIVVEENADRLYKKTYFFNEILKIQFFPTNCFSNTAKAVDIKIISPMNFCSDRSLCLSKNQSLKAVNPQKKYEQYHFFLQKKCIFYRKSIFLLFQPCLMEVQFFYPKQCDTIYISIYQKARSFLAVSFIIFE